MSLGSLEVTQLPYVLVPLVSIILKLSNSELLVAYNLGWHPP